MFRRRPPRRRKNERFEGWWEPTPNTVCARVGGKIEWDGFDNGDSEIELFASVPDLADGSAVEVIWGDEVVMSVIARSGVVKKDLETDDGDDVPRLARQAVELRCAGQVIARTVLDPD